MGSWSLTIHGHGIHDNDKDEDVDRILEAFVRELRESGHQLDAAYLTIGSGRKYFIADEFADGSIKVRTF